MKYSKFRNSPYVEFLKESGIFIVRRVIILVILTRIMIVSSIKNTTYYLTVSI